MKIVVDTNVFVAGLMWPGMLFAILEAWQNGKFELVISCEILEEYERITERLARKYKKEEVVGWAKILIKKAKVYESFVLPEPVSRDPNDDMFIACALAAQVKIIVSGDLDLLTISGYQGIKVLTPAQFIKQYC